MPSEISTQAALAVLFSGLIELLKRSRYFPWINAQTSKLNAIAGVVAAGIAAFGVHAAYDRTTGTLVTTGLTLPALGHFLYDWTVQWAIQHGYWQVRKLAAKTM